VGVWDEESHSMRNGLENRLSRLEKRVADRTEKPTVCNCRVETRFHNADCLDAILKGIRRVCSVHGFRDLGFFFWTSEQYPLLSEDNQPCPCPPHPWRSFVLSEGPHTWEGHHAVAEAAVQPDPTFNLQKDNRRSTEILADYYAARQQWVGKSRRQLTEKNL
jgi:hypothetical protein